MSDTEMIVLASSMSGEPNQGIVSAYLSMAADAILNRAYPFAADANLSSMTVPRKYQNLQVEIAVYLLDKRGAEGQTAHNENGINRSYESGGIPDSILKQVVPFCAVPGGASDADTETESD